MFSKLADMKQQERFYVGQGGALVSLGLFRSLPQLACEIEKLEIIVKRLRTDRPIHDRLSPLLHKISVILSLNLTL